MTSDITESSTNLRYLVSDLCALLESYLSKEQVREVYRAYLFAAEAHEGQYRISGEPYIYHPIAVARILADMHMDADSLVAAILHDVIEDTATAKEQLAHEFGKDVAELVDGVSKLTQIKFESKAEAQAENFRKMIMAMVRDIRVILVKLADRLHNMRTLGVMRPDKKRRIAKETLEIYAPIANRLGLNTIRLELEDLGFAACYPMRYRILLDARKKARGNRKEIIHNIEDSIQNRLQQENLVCTTTAREKHIYSIYLKMIEKSLPFAEVFDVYAFRLIVDKVDDCYRALGIMHNLYKPVPGKFKDYIAIPKSNGYQSLHTVLFGPYGVPIEVQIRTIDMNSVAEAGIAAHWLYKSEDKASNNAQSRVRDWLRELLDLQKNAGNSLEFLENVKVDLFPDKVYVFTPRGEIMELPRGSTAVDFAYAVHTDVGNTCIAAKVNRRLAPLRSPLFNGQTIEIIAAPGAHPNPSWLNFVVTGKARTNIRHYLKNLHRDDGISLGKRLLEKALMSLDSSLEEIPKQQITKILTNSGFNSFDELLEDIGVGNRTAPLVARQLAPMTEDESNSLARHQQTAPFAIKGTEGVMVNYARCCHPIPGDSIIGFISAGRGIVIHEADCKNIAETRPHPEKWIDVEWANNIDTDFSVELHVEVNNERGVLATVAAAIADTSSNIENVHIDERDGSNITLIFTIAVQGRKHLAQIMRHVRTIPAVVRLSRWKV